MKQMMKYLCGLLILGLASCGVDVGYKSTYLLKCWEQAESGAELVRLEELRLFGYRADTTDWRILSYEDALEGRFVAANGSGEELTPSLVGQLFEVEGYGVAQGLEAQGYGKLMVLAVDTKNRLYGYTQYAMPENLPKLYASLVFQPWKKSSAFKNGTWWMFNEFYRPDITARVRPTVEREEGAETVALKGVSLFVYEVEDAALWLPTDYDQATMGNLTNQESGEEISPLKSFSGDSAGVISISLPEGDYLMMVIDYSSRSYALRPFAASEASTEIALCFSPWREESPYSFEEWTIYSDKQLEEENPSEDEQ